MEVHMSRYVSRSCQTTSAVPDPRASGDCIPDELVECCQKLIQTRDYHGDSGPEEVPVCLAHRRRNGGSDADASGTANSRGCRRFKFISFLSRLHGQPKQKQPPEKARPPRWSARARQRFHKLASWVHALRLALRRPGETAPAPEEYRSPAAAEAEQSPFVEIPSEEDADSWPQDCFQDVPL
ncbi:uncharacterized protein LOC144136449 [Amblyomma americanum]